MAENTVALQWVFQSKGIETKFANTLKSPKDVIWKVLDLYYLANASGILRKPEKIIELWDENRIFISVDKD